MLSAAEHGPGAALARSSIVGSCIETGRLLRLPGPELPGRYAYHLIYPAHRRLRPAAQAFADWLLKQANS